MSLHGLHEFVCHGAALHQAGSGGDLWESKASKVVL